MAAAPREAGLLRVRVQPRASRSEIVGWRADGMLSVRVSAPPVEGAANIAVGALLASAFGVRTSAVSVVHGERGRDKTVRVAGLTLTEMKRRLTDRGGPP
jgi:uncharacterized protein (TIGR00251 family)